MCSFFFLYFFLFHSVCRNFSNDLSKTSSVAYNIAHCCCLCDLKSSFMAINRFCSPQQQTIPLQISLLVSSYWTMPWTEMFLWRITSTYWHESLLFPATMKSAHKYIRFLGVFFLNYASSEIICRFRFSSSGGIPIHLKCRNIAKNCSKHAVSIGVNSVKTKLTPVCGAFAWIKYQQLSVLMVRQVKQSDHIMTWHMTWTHSCHMYRLYSIVYR